MDCMGISIFNIMKLFSIERQDANQHSPSFSHYPENNNPGPSFKQWEGSRQLNKPRTFDQELPNFISQNQKRSVLYTQPAHISIDRSPATRNDDIEEERSSRRSLTPRKKIFQQEYLSSKLKQALIADIQPEPKPQIKEIKTQNPQFRSQLNPREEEKVQKTNIIIPQQRPRQPNFERQADRSVKRSNYPINYDRRNTDHILTQFVLTEERDRSNPPHPSEVTTTVQPKNNRYLNMIPQLVQRMKRNEKEISQLKSMLQQLIEEEKGRERNLRNYLSQNQQMAMERNKSSADPGIQKVYVQEYERDKIREEQIMKKDLEKEQMKRLELLIEENRYLCHKVMEQKMRNSASDQMENTRTYQDKINQLHKQKEVFQKNKAEHLNNLDISVIPHSREEERPKKHEKIAPAFNFAPPPQSVTHPKAINPLMERLRVPVPSQIPVRQVPRTKIY